MARAAPQVVYAHLKWMWASGNREEALGLLKDFTARMSNDLRGGNNGLLARCYLKKGEWQKVLQEDWNPVGFCFFSINLHLSMIFFGFSTCST